MSGSLTLSEELLANLSAQGRPMTCAELYEMSDVAKDTTHVAQTLRPLFDAGRIQRFDAPPGTGSGIRFLYAAIGVEVSVSARTGARVVSRKEAPAVEPQKFRDPAQFPDRPAVKLSAWPAPTAEKKPRVGRKRKAMKIDVQAAPAKPQAPAHLAAPISEFRTQAMQKLQATAAIPDGFRCALWCDGELVIEKKYATVKLDLAEARALFSYLDLVLRPAG